MGFTGLPGLGGAGGAGGGMGQLSPYLNIDPSYLQNSAPEYIFDTEAKRGKLRRTQITNYTLKSGALVSNALGSIAVSYSVLYCLLSLAHEDHDEAKSVVSGTLTGLMFKSTSGLKKCARGGLLGFGLSTLWAFGLKPQESIQHYL